MEKGVNVQEKILEGYIRAILIIEILGRPPEHVTQALNTVLASMKQDKKLIVLRQKTYRPKRAIDSKELFTAFMEVEVLTNGLIKLFEVCFDYMPSSIEIIEPAGLKLTAAQANAVVNDLAGRLHKFGEVAKRLNMEKQILQEKLNQVLQGKPIIKAEEVKLEIEKKEDSEEEKKESE